MNQGQDIRETRQTDELHIVPEQAEIVGRSMVKGLYFDCIYHEDFSDYLEALKLGVERNVTGLLETYGEVCPDAIERNLWEREPGFIVEYINNGLSVVLGDIRREIREA